MSQIRLNKFIATQLGIGRRQADHLIEKGQVKVGNEKAKLGTQIDPEEQSVIVNDKPIDNKKAFTYIALHKPVGYVCSRKKQDKSPTIFELLPKKYHHLKPVGRLDKDSSGLILLTNDGDFAHRMTHPSFKKTKQYQVALDKPLTQKDVQSISKGVELPDGISKLELKKIPSSNNQLWKITMHEGRNRQIRRTFAHLDYKVIRLHRTDFGDYKLDMPSEEIKIIDKI